MSILHKLQYKLQKGQIIVFPLSALIICRITYTINITIVLYSCSSNILHDMDKPAIKYDRDSMLRLSYFLTGSGFVELQVKFCNEIQ